MRTGNTKTKMRLNVRTGCLIVGTCAVGLYAAPALANNVAGPSAKLDRFADDSQSVPTVAPGQEIGIACDAIQYRAPGNDVRVVLTISAPPSGAAQPGYRKVLATNEQLSKDAVHVRIPQIPDLANHTVTIDVYVISAGGARNCTAGSMRIADSALTKQQLDHRS